MTNLTTFLAYLRFARRIVMATVNLGLVLTYIIRSHVTPLTIPNTHIEQSPPLTGSVPDPLHSQLSFQRQFGSDGSETAIAPGEFTWNARFGGPQTVNLHLNL